MPGKETPEANDKGTGQLEAMREGLLGPKSGLPPDLKQKLSEAIDDALKRGKEPFDIVQTVIDALREPGPKAEQSKG